MKKLLIPLIAAFAANTVSAAAPQQVIDISTDKVSMVLTAAPGGEVYFRHFGGRIDDPAPLADYKSNRRSDHGTEDLAYPATGGRNFREPALRVTHADGDMNTELRYVSHASKQLSDKNVTETVVKMTDCCQALDVELVFTAYARENVITTHAVIRNREKGPVTLHSFYSSSLPLKADKYLLTHLYGAWAREAQVDHTLLTHGSKSIESTREVRTTHTENPAFLLTLNSDSFSETCGEVIAGALAWSGNFRLNFEVDEFDVLTVLAGANPNASEYRLRPGETFTTPEMIYTHSFCGAGGASRNLHDWARNYGVYHGPRGRPHAAQQLGRRLLQVRRQGPETDDRRRGLDGIGNVRPRRRLVRQQIPAQQLQRRTGRLASERRETPRRHRPHRLLRPLEGTEVRHLDRTGDGQPQERAG